MAGDSSTAQAELDDVQTELEHVARLENATFSQIATGSSVERLGGTLANNLDAQRALAEIASSSAPLRSNVVDVNTASAAGAGRGGAVCGRAGRLLLSVSQPACATPRPRSDRRRVGARGNAEARPLARIVREAV
ncbi:MAG: hypothetical protein H0T43_00225 [Solirubrobacterales bacterium]|nr:hypothetical protein [Solirubrobacterales bacterium]